MGLLRAGGRAACREALGIMRSDADLTQGTLRLRRAVQRRTYDHGCRVEDRESRRAASVAVPTAPSDANGGTQLAQTKTNASRRTIALPSPSSTVGWARW